jgi:hypothetical protein
MQQSTSSSRGERLTFSIAFSAVVDLPSSIAAVRASSKSEEKLDYAAPRGSGEAIQHPLNGKRIGWDYDVGG